MLDIFKILYLKFFGKETKNIAFGLQAFETVKNLLIQKNYNSIPAAYQQLDNNDKSLLLEGIKESLDLHPSILEWQKNQPESFDAHLFAGVARTSIAWEIRSGRRANEVAREAFEEFWDVLEVAKENINTAISIDPQQAEPYARLIRINMGLQDKKDALNAFDKLLEIDAFHLQGHMLMFNLLTPKWAGSFDEMKAFAIKARDKDLGGLLTVIYLMFVNEVMMNGEESSSDESDEVLIARAKTQFRANVNSLYNMVNKKKPQSLSKYYLNNYFSFIFYAFDDKFFCQQEIDKIGDNISFFPWAYFGVEGKKSLLISKYSL